MEVSNKIENPQEIHSSGELKNLWTCQGIIRDWTSHPEWSSYDVLPVLFVALHTGRKTLRGKRSAPTLASTIRNSDAFLTDAPGDLLAPHEDIYMLTSQYSKWLDEVLREKPKSLPKAIEDAAKAYYIFDRIHPFPDGNGRVGRMIIKRVLKTANAKDPLFHDQRWFGEERSDYIRALEQVHRTNNLIPYELFIARSLIKAYDPIRDFFRHRELSTFISRKEKAEQRSRPGAALTDIWEGFAGIPIYGNKPTKPTVTHR